MLDAVLVLAFVVYALVVALRSRRQASTGLEGYFLAGRRLTKWESGLSMTATQYAADTPLLAAGLVATGGVFALWRLWVYGLAFLALGFLLGACWWRARVVTDAELCELRYGGRPAVWLRAAKALYYGVLFNCAVLAMVLAATVRVAEPFLPWDLWLPAAFFDPLVAMVRSVGAPLAADPDASDVWVRSAANLVSVVLIYGFTVLYSTTGGLRGVARTDLGQLAVLSIASLGYGWVAFDAAGGAEGIRSALASNVGAARATELLALDPWGAAEVSGAFLGVLGLQWLVQMNSDGTGYLAQRCMACRTPEDAGAAPVLFAFAQVLGRSLLWLPVLVALLVLYPLGESPSAAQRELTFVQGIETLLPPGLRGLMLVGMLAALASTLDSHLNWGASYVANDLYARGICRGVLRREPAGRELVWVARLAGPLVMLVSVRSRRRGTRPCCSARAWAFPSGCAGCGGARTPGASSRPSSSREPRHRCCSRRWTAKRAACWRWRRLEPPPRWAPPSSRRRRKPASWSASTRASSRPASGGTPKRAVACGSACRRPVPRPSRCTRPWWPLRPG
jgi:Na+/proline symporter